MTPSNGLTLYDIANNRPLLRSMTVESGQELTYEEQVAKLDSLMERKKQRHTAKVRQAKTTPPF